MKIWKLSLEVIIEINANFSTEILVQPLLHEHRVSKEEKLYS